MANKTKNIKQKHRRFNLRSDSIRTKLIIFVCTMTLIVVVLLSSVNFFSLNSGVHSAVDQMMNPLTAEASADVAGKIQLLLNKGEIVLQRTLGSSGMGNSTSAKSFLGYQMNENDLDVKDYALLKSGEYYLSSDRFGKSDEVMLSNLYAAQKAKLAGKAVISDPEPTEDGSGSEFIVAVPGTSNVTNYMLIMYFDAQVLTDIVNSISFSENSYSYIINSSGTIIASSNLQDVIDGVNPMELGETDYEYNDISEISRYVLGKTTDHDGNVIEPEAGSRIATVDGVKSRVAYSPIENTEWAFLLIGPQSDFNGTLNSTTTVLLIFTFVLLTAAFFATVKIMNGVVNPIIDVTDRLKLLADGDLATPTPIINQKNEIGVLSESLAKTVQSMSKYIDDISDALDNIANGNLAFEMDGEYQGDFIRIKDSFNSILERLRKMFRNISNSANTVTSGAQQVASGAQLLSEGAIRQSQAVSEVSDSVNNISAIISESAKAASETDGLVGEIEGQVKSCNSEMTKMLDSINDISESSAEISQIIQVIDDIAFQTNILALNAAVEAARAGDAGLGFAVVADEVRNLANMSAEAAKKTSDLIEGSLKYVKRGNMIAKSTAESLDKIVAGILGINERVREIAESAEQQHNLITEINESVRSVSAVIDNTSSTSEECSAASVDMSDQAANLRDMIEFFKIDFKVKEKPKSNVPKPINPKPGTPEESVKFIPNEETASTDIGVSIEDIPVYDQSETTIVDSGLDIDNLENLNEDVPSEDDIGEVYYEPNE